MSINKRKRESNSPVVSSITNQNDKFPIAFISSSKTFHKTSSGSNLKKCQKTDSSIVRSFSSNDFLTSISQKYDFPDLLLHSERQASQELFSPKKQSSNKIRTNNISNSSSSSSVNSSDSSISITESSEKITRQFSNSSLPSDLNDSEASSSFADFSSAQISNSSSMNNTSVFNNSTFYKSVKPLQSAFLSTGLLSKHHQHDASFTNSPVPLANSSSIFVDQNDDEPKTFNSINSPKNSKTSKKIAPGTPYKRNTGLLLNSKGFDDKNTKNEVSFRNVLKRSSMNSFNNSQGQITESINCLQPIRFNNNDFLKDKENLYADTFNLKENLNNSKEIKSLSAQISSELRPMSKNVSTLSKDSKEGTQNGLYNKLLFSNLSNPKNKSEKLSNTSSFKKRAPLSLKLDSSFITSNNLNDGFDLLSPNLDSLCSPLSPNYAKFSFGSAGQSSQESEKEYENDMSSPVTSKFTLQKHKKMDQVNNKNGSCTKFKNDNVVKPLKHNSRIDCGDRKSKLKTTNLNSNRYSLMRSCSVENYFNQNPSITAQPPLKTPKTPMFCIDSNFDEDSIFLCNKFGHENVEIIGKGEFSKVYKVQFKSKTYAIKQLMNGKRSVQLFKSKTKHKLPTNLNNDPISKFLCMYQEYKFTRLEEVQLLNYIKQRQLLTKSNKYFYKELIVSYVDFFNHENFDYIIMDYYAKGSFAAFLSSQKESTIPEFTTWKILLNLLEAVSFLHSEGIIHLDLKPDNIFINSSNNLTIADFGMSVMNYKDSDSPLKLDREGDRIYIAPEILTSSIYTPAADIFSLGLIILETSANIYLPNNGESWQKLRNEDLSDASPISRKKASKAVNENLGELNFVNDGYSLESIVKLMLCSNFEERVNADALLQMSNFELIKQYAEMGSTIVETKYIFTN